VKRLNGRLGIDMKPVTGLTWSQVLSKAKQREIDVIPCIARTQEREKYLLFTKPYLKFQSVIVTREDAPFISGLPDLSDKPVGVVQGYITHEVIGRDYPMIKLKTYSTVEEGLRAVIDKDIVGFVDNLASITFTIRQKELEKIKVASTTEYTFDLAFGVRPDTGKRSSDHHQGGKSVDLRSLDQHSVRENRGLGLYQECCSHYLRFCCVHYYRVPLMEQKTV
jgi:ABC-type amino acid transport substrate-binding protein